MNGTPFEFQGYDAAGYHNEALWAVDLINTDRFYQYFDYIDGNYSDMGFPLYLTFYYLFFGKLIILPRIANAVLSAWTCITVYKLGRRNFGESAGRIGAILCMLLPNLIYYCGLHMKETLMIFIVVLFVERTDYLFRSKVISFKNIIVAGLLGFSLFFFRTVIGVIAFLSIIMALLFLKSKLNLKYKRILIGAGVMVALFLVFSSKIFEELDTIVEKASSNQEAQMQNYANREAGNRLAVYGTKSIFIGLMIVAPFPTLVHSYQDNAEMINGAIYTRNIYAFFVLIALLSFFKRKMFRKHILILSFLFGYLTVLALSGFALSERFHLPAVPFLIILAGYGVTRISKKNIKFYPYYLFLMSIIIIGWNWFKLVGRDLI